MLKYSRRSCIRWSDRARVYGDVRESDKFPLPSSQTPTDRRMSCNRLPLTLCLTARRSNTNSHSIRTFRHAGFATLPLPSSCLPQGSQDLCRSVGVESLLFTHVPWSPFSYYLIPLSLNSLLISPCLSSVAEICADRRGTTVNEELRFTVDPISITE